MSSVPYYGYQTWIFLGTLDSNIVRPHIQAANLGT